jgi:acetyltransferase-like isoleucine patch superfamily enzyme
MIKTILRLLLIPFGLVIKLIKISNIGARDLQNKFRFKGANIDGGCCINESSIIAPNTHLLSNCIINNSQISSYTYIGKNCIVQNSNIGKFCSIANDVFIGLGKHPTNLISTSTLFYKTQNTLNLQLVEKDHEFKEYENISIGHDVWIGARAIILDGITIGNGSIIAANSVVTKNVPAYAIVAGVPAKILKYRFQQNKIDELQKLEWWNWSLAEIKLKIKELNYLLNDYI